MFMKRHVLSMREFSKEEIDSVLDLAQSLEPLARGKKSSMLAGKILALLFFEPSTRTRMSFETAMKRLGGSVINLGPAEGSSISKGESLADTVRVIGGYADALVIRHPKEGSARLASQFSPVPVLNAGDGAGHHPTQTLLDLYTIRKESRLENLHVALVGDLKYGRTVHSLAHAMALFGARMVFISPSSLAMPPHVLTELAESGVSFRIVSSPEEAQDSEMDVLYVTRIQKERFGDPQEYESVAHSYRVTRETVAVLGDSIRIMHPLPRVDEIAEEVDSLPNAIYFRQAHNGIPTRQALLGLVTGGIS